MGQRANNMIVGLFGLSGNGRDWVHWVQKTDEIYGFWGASDKAIADLGSILNDSCFSTHKYCWSQDFLKRRSQYFLNTDLENFSTAFSSKQMVQICLKKMLWMLCWPAHGEAAKLMSPLSRAHGKICWKHQQAHQSLDSYMKGYTGIFQLYICFFWKRILNWDN